jgi:hypothetical protein
MAKLDLKQAFRRLFRAAQRFEQRAPKYQKLEADRQELRDALTNAALLLSVSGDGDQVETSGRQDRKRDKKQVA